jgi:hypothetical protein
MQLWYLCNTMRYTYLIKDQQGKEEEYKAMSYKKLLKQLNNKYKPNEVIQVKYTNKKDHDLLKYVKIKRVE